MTAQEFPLAWRWTQSEHGIMPPHVLASILPLEASEAAPLNERSMAFYQQSRMLSPSVFGAIVSQRADIPINEARVWLLEQQPGDFPVYVSWQSDLAVRTTWRVFVDYWDSFCYPSSDDVAVWPESEQWVLAYHHYELFEFGKKLSA